MHKMVLVNEELKWDEKRWLVLYDAWQESDFQLLAKYELSPKDYIMSNAFRSYQRVIRKTDGQVIHLYF